MTDKIAKKLSPTLNEKQAKTLLSLMRDGRLKDSKLKEILGFKSENAASYRRRKLEKEGIIKGYTAIIDWGKLGYKTKFIVLVDAVDKDTFHRIEREHVLAANEYLRSVGEIILIPTLFDPVLLKEVSTCYGVIGYITGYALDEDSVKNYANVYLTERYPGIKTTIYFLKSMTVEDFFIHTDFIEKYNELSPPTEEDIERLTEFREKFIRRPFKQNSK